MSCSARRQSNHYLTAEAPPCCCEFRPVAAGSCSSAEFSTMGYALQRSLSVVAGCLSNSRLRQQWACISVGAGCLGNCRLPQQWACVSVGVGCLGSGGCPSPTERLRDRLHGEHLESPFCLSHCAIPYAVSLQSPGLAHCPSPFQSQVQPSQVSGCHFNRAPRQAHLVGIAG